MPTFRDVFVLAVLVSLVSGGCSAAADIEETATTRPVETAEQGTPPARVPTATASPTSTPLPSPTATPQPTIEPTTEELAPVGHYEVLTRNGESTVHIWVEFTEGCLEAGEPTVGREGMTIQVTVPLVHREDVACEREYRPTEVYVPLDTSGMEPGTYTVIVNNGQDTYEPTYPTLELVSIAPTPPAGCPVPTEGTALFVDETGTYCVLYPVGWHTEGNRYYSPYLTGGDEAVRAGLSFRAAGPAEGRTLDQIVQEIFGQELADPNLSAELTMITLDGEPAALIKNVSGRGLSDHWIVIHEGSVYEGTVGPYDIGPSTPYAQEAFTLFMRTLTWLR